MLRSTRGISIYLFDFKTESSEDPVGLEVSEPVKISASAHYARAQELEPWLDLVAIRGEVFVQFWLKPGEAAVTLGLGEEREVERIPEQLRRFL